MVCEVVIEQPVEKRVDKEVIIENIIENPVIIEEIEEREVKVDRVIEQEYEVVVPRIKKVEVEKEIRVIKKTTQQNPKFTHQRQENVIDVDRMVTVP